MKLQMQAQFQVSLTEESKTEAAHIETVRLLDIELVPGQIPKSGGFLHGLGALLQFLHGDCMFPTPTPTSPTPSLPVPEGLDLPWFCLYGCY